MFRQLLPWWLVAWGSFGVYLLFKSTAGGSFFFGLYTLCMLGAFALASALTLGAVFARVIRHSA